MEDVPRFANDGERLTHLLQILEQEKRYAHGKMMHARGDKDRDRANYWHGMYVSASKMLDYVAAMQALPNTEGKRAAMWRTLLGYAVDFGKEIVIGTISDFIRG